MLSIVIPAYNEELRLPATLEDIDCYLRTKKIDYEISIVSDGSTDRTAALVRELAKKDKRLKLLVNEQNRGKGLSVKRGILAVQGELILFMDADSSTRISELEGFYPLLDNYDIVIGSRALPNSRIIEHQPWLREKTGKLFNLLIQLFLLKGIRDTQCGFKLFKREAALAIFPRVTVDRFIFDVEVLLLARKLGYRVAEAPVAWKNSRPSKVAFRENFFDIFLGLIRLIIEKKFIS